MESSSLNSDEIDLFELMQTLWNGKWLIASFTALGILLSGAYAFMAIPTYQVQSILRPSLTQNLDELNGTGLIKIEPQEALQQIGAELDSYTARHNFFTEHKELAKPLLENTKSLQRLLEELNKGVLNIARPAPSKSEGFSNYISVQFEYPAGVDGVGVVQGLINDSINNELSKLKSNFESARGVRLAALKLKIEAGQSSYQESKGSLTELATQNIVSQLPNGIKTELAKALLDSQKFKAEQRYLEGLNPDWSKVKPVIIDQPALKPLSPIKPKKVLILAIGTLLGGMLGGMTVLSASAYRNAKRQRAAKP